MSSCPTPTALRPWVPEFAVDYQREGVGFAATRNAAYFVWAAGAGKTLAAVWTALVWQEWSRRKVVVITKAPVRDQFRREIERFTTIRPQVLTGRTAHGIPDAIDWVVLGWPTLVAWKSELCRWARGGVVVFDELHCAKQWKRRERFLSRANRVAWRDLENVSAAAASLAKVCDYRLGLSATPVANNLMDLWSQQDILEPGQWESSWEYAHCYCDATPGEYGGLDTSGKSNLDQLRQNLRRTWHRVKQAQVNRFLPAKRRQLVYLRKEDQSRPAAFARDLRRAAKQGRQTLLEMRLMEAATRKQKWLVDTVMEALICKQKVVVFTGRQRDCEKLAELFSDKIQKRGMKCPVWFGHGGYGPEHVDRTCTEYMAHKGAALLVGTGDAYGEGKNLQDSDLLILAMLPYTPRQILQRENRVARLGQSRPVLVLYPIAEGTEDERISSILLPKLEQVSEAVGDEEAEAVMAAVAGDDSEEEILARILWEMDDE